MGMTKAMPVPASSFAESAPSTVGHLGLGRLRHKIEEIRSLALEIASETDLMSAPRAYDLDAGIDLQEEVKQFEVTLIKRALVKSGFCQAKAARILNVNASTLAYKIKTYEIAIPQ